MSRLEKRKRKSVINQLTTSGLKKENNDTIVEESLADSLKPQAESVIEASNAAPKPAEKDDSAATVNVLFEEDLEEGKGFDSESSKISFKLALKAIRKNSSKPKDRLSAIRLLRDAVCPATHKLLIQLSNDEDKKVRSASISALLEQKYSDIDFLSDLLKNDKDAGIRLSALRRIYEVAGADSISILGTAVLNDTCADVRRRAVAILGEIGLNNCIEYLSNALNDKSSSVRKSAAESLGIIGLVGFPLSKVRLKRLINDEDEFVRKSAEKSIKRIDELVKREKLEAFNIE